MPRAEAEDPEPDAQDASSDWQMQHETNESPFGGVLLPSRQGKLTKGIGEQKKETSAKSVDQRHEDVTEAALNPATEEVSFPDPLDMPGSFTAAICECPDFETKPLLSLTLKDVVPPTHSPTTPRCVLLRQFEIGLDGVEGIIVGEVNIPESTYWTNRVREARLGKLGYSKLSDGAYSNDLEQKQRRNGWGQGKWVFFGVKFKQSIKEKGRKTGKWLCFGAPVEAVEKQPSTEQDIEIGGGKDEFGKDVPAHTKTFVRESTRFSLGGTACMDLWEGAKEWDNGIFSEVSNAMANVGLVVETLHTDTRPPRPDWYDSTRPSFDPSELEYEDADGAVFRENTRYADSPATAAMDGAAESQKRKRSIVAEPPRKLSGTSKIKASSPQLS